MKAPYLKPFAKGGNLFVRAHLYILDDHLLYVEGTYRETLRHFQYKDLHAILWTRDPGAAWRYGMVVAFFVILGMIPVLTFQDWLMGCFFWACALLPLFRFLYLKRKGGRVRCSVLTALKRYRIRCVRTGDQAEALMAHLESQIPPEAPL